MSEQLWAFIVCRAHQFVLLPTCSDFNSFLHFLNYENSNQKRVNSPKYYSRKLLNLAYKCNSRTLSSTSTMFKRKSAISTPSSAGVYRHKSNKSDQVEMTGAGGHVNPTFVPDLSDQPARIGSLQDSVGSNRSGSCNSRSSGVDSLIGNNVQTPVDGKDGLSGKGAGWISKEDCSPMVENQADPKKSSQPQLKKSINLLHCTAILIAITGHSAIFISPSSILHEVGSIGASLIIWLVGGLINLGLALCFTELSTMMPQAGGPYTFVRRTFGPLPGFLILWGYVVLIAGPFWAFLSYTAALYIVKPVFPDCHQDQVETAIKVLAAWIMITIVVLNCVYMKYVTKIQTFLSGTKIFALIIIIAGGIYEMANGNTENFENIFEGSTLEPGKYAVALFYSLFSYGGWPVVTSLMEEVKNPGRDLPVSVYLTFVVVIVQYIMANVAYFSLITPQTLLQSDAVALLFVQRLYKPLTVLISVFVTTTCIGALNASIMGHSRLLFAGARAGHMPVIMGMIHPKYLTPWPAIFVLMVWGLVMMYSGSLTDIMEFISLFSTIMGIAVVCSLLYLRRTRPNDARPYKTMLIVPLSQLLINVAVLVLAIYQKPHRMGIGLAILFAGIPVYWLGVLWRVKPRDFTELVEGLTIIAQKLFLICKSQ